MTLLGILAAVIGFGAAILVFMGVAPVFLQQVTLLGWLGMGCFGLVLLMLGRRPND